MPRLCSGIVVALLLVGTLGVSPSPAPVPSAAAADNNPTWCPILASVTILDSTRLAFYLLTPIEPGRASGTVSLYTATSRYDVRFSDAYVAKYRQPSSPQEATAFVVRFPNPVTVNTAAVTALDSPTPRPCNALYSPWLRRAPVPEAALTPEDRARSAAFRARFEALPAQMAPAPVAYTPASCAQPFVAARTVAPFVPVQPYENPLFRGVVHVWVTIGVDGRAVDTEVLKTSGDDVIDAVARDAAERSLYSAETFECAKIIGTYLFGVDFTR